MCRLRLELHLLVLACIGFFTVAVQSAHADTPVITTAAATVVTNSSAQMNGTVNPMGSTLTVRVEYGSTTSYGIISQTSSSLSGSGVQSVGFVPTGLVSNTIYHYRIVATDGTSTYVGNDMVFTTQASPPSVSSVIVEMGPVGGLPFWRTFSATSVSAGSSPATVSYEYGATTDYGMVATDPTPLAKDSFTAQTPGITAYYVGFGVTHYRCKVVNQQGTSYSPDMTFTLSEPEVTTTAATGVTDIQATLTGMVKADDLRVNIAFEYGPTTSYGQTATVINSGTPQGLTPVSIPIQSLPAATTYHYRLKVTYPNYMGPVYYGADQTFTTAAAATPPTAGVVSMPILGVTEVQAACSPIFAGSSAATAVFEYGPTTAYGSTVAVADTLPRYYSDATVMAGIYGLAPGTTYHVRCVVTNGEGTAASADATFTTAALPDITTVAATSVGDLSAVFNGSYTPHGSTAECLVHFDYGTTTDYDRVVRPSPLWMTSAGTFAATANDLQPGTTYHYRAVVTYAFATSLSAYGQDMTFTTAAARTPPTVSDITTQIPDVTAVKLGATYTTGSSMAAIFCEYQAPGGPVQTLNWNSTLPLGSSGPITIQLSYLQPSTTYTCRMGITNDQGTTYSAYISISTLAGATVTTGAASGVADVTAVLHGTAVANGAATYFCTFDVGTTTSYGLSFTPPANAFTGSNTITPAATALHLQPNTTYHYRLRATQYVQLAYSTSILGAIYGEDQTFTTGPPATPPFFTAASTSAIATTAATLNASFETGSSPATVVFQYGTTTAYGSQYTMPTSFAASMTGSTAYALQGLTTGTAYHYRVVVTNNEGVSTGPDMSFTTNSPPTVTTGAATAVAATLATLNGTYIVNGVSYNPTFDFGETTAYGQTATPAKVLIKGGGGISTQSTSAYAFPLQPLTTYHFRLKLTDSYGTSYYGGDATLTTVTPVQAWRQQKFSTLQDAGSAADMANPSGDGMPNLLKYALSMDPTRAGVPPQPQVKDYDGAQHLSLTFTRDPAKTDLTYEVQAADNPGGPWTTLASSAGGAAASGSGVVGEVPTGGGTAIIIGGPPAPPQPMVVEVKDLISMQDAPRRFMRLQVTRQ